MMAGTGLIFFLFALGISGCVSKQVRVLDDSERLRHGLTGIIYDARLCPATRDEITGQLRIENNCETVNCGPKDGKIECTARKEEIKGR
jgi:hypothetical protein